MPKPRTAPTIDWDALAAFRLDLDPKLFPEPKAPPDRAAQKPMGLAKRNGPRARPHRSMFYIDRAVEAWGKLQEVLAAPLPEDAVVDRDAVARVAADLAKLRGQAADWLIDVYRQHPPRSHPRPHQRAVLDAIYREAGRRGR